MINIRLAEIVDIQKAEEIYGGARDFMRESGNDSQWGSVYPPHEIIVSDINEKRLYVAEERGEVLAVFCFFVGSDPTYAKIYDGNWKSTDPCGVIHRVAVSNMARGRGVSQRCFEYCSKRSPSLKIDTHSKNIPMQRALLKFGFEYCGIIYLPDGQERLAYQFQCK